jgi:nitrous oxidase accessory protein NosD
MKNWLAVTVCILCFACITQADIVRVPQDYPTIQSGINAAETGDTVLVSSGTYMENINFNGKAIIVRAESGFSETVIDGQQNGSVVTFENGEDQNSVLRDFTLRFGLGSGSPSYKGGGITCSGSSPTITRNILWSNSAVRGGGFYLNDSSADISHCVIIDNTATFDGGAVYVRTSSGPTVTPRFFNCLVTGNQSDYGAGIFIYNANPDVINCTFDSNDGREFAGGIYNMAESQAVIQNTLITNSINGHGIYALDEGSAPSVEYCDVWNNAAGEFGGGASPGTGCITLDPLYSVGYSGHHYISQIAAGQPVNSPCLNAGGSMASALGLDQYTTRTDHGLDIELVDMGYHYSPEILPTATPTIVPSPTRTPTPVPPTATPPPPTQPPTHTPEPRILRVPQDYTYIQTAITAANNGDVILVAAGTYYERINFLGKQILVKSESGYKQTIIDGSASGTVVTFNAGETNMAILREFTIQNGLGSSSTYLLAGGIQISDGACPVIEGCLITENMSPKGAGILVSDTGSAPIIRFNEITDNIAESGDGGALYITQDANPFIFSNLIVNNTAGYGGGIFVTESDPRVLNNTLYRNTGDSFGGGMFYLSASGEVINNCIVSQLEGEGIYIYEDAITPVLYHNNIWGNSGGNYGGAAYPGLGDINANPHFVPGPNGDFYLSNVQAGQEQHSMCIDNGYYDADEIGLDEYTTRTDHHADMLKSDIGFHYGYEPMYTPTPTATPTPECIYDSRIVLNQEVYYPGDRFYLYLRLLNTCGEMIYVDQIIMLDVLGEYWFWPGWTEQFDYQPVKMPTYMEVLPILDFIWPEIEGSMFDLWFWSAAFETDHIDIDHLVGDIISVKFGFASPHE